MITRDQHSFPEDRWYDIDNQIWYLPIVEAKIRVGFTSWAVSFMGEVLVFTPKRIGRDFEKGRSFAVIEGGKWVGSARAAFDGTVSAHNEALIRRPELLGEDAYGEGWLVDVQPRDLDWQAGLVTGAAVGPAFDAWLASEGYKSRTEGESR
jgi:glycine cleavage system H protein